MRRPARFTAVLTLFLCLCLLQAAQAFKNEPGGFRGLAWETRRHKIQGLTLVEERTVGGQHITVCTRDSDSLRYKGVELKRIRYVFLEGRFFLVHLVATGSRSKYTTLRSALLEEFGQPSAAFPRRDRFYWEGEQVTLSLEYDDFPERSVISFYYRPIGEKLRQGS